MHCFDATAMGLLRGIQKRGSAPCFPPWAHGGIAHRRREDSILTLLAAKWRAEEDKLSHAIANHDEVNAFGSTKRDKILLRAVKGDLPADRHIHVSSITQNYLTIDTEMGPSSINPQ